MSNISARLAQELNASEQQVLAATTLLDEGATVPFIARYRKEVTGGLDDSQLRLLEQRLSYLRELEERRAFITKTIDEQGKLTAQLASDIAQANSKTELEDLYLPYKPKRRTKGQIAIEAGIEPLADRLFEDPNLSPDLIAEDFINTDAGFADTKSVLDGAKFILMERFAEDAKLLAKFRAHISANAQLQSRVIKGQEDNGSKYRDYFEHNELLSKVPSHRALAMLRARNEGVLQITINPEPEAQDHQQFCAQMIADHYGLVVQGAAASEWLMVVVQWAWKVKLSLHLENEFLGSLREKAESGAIDVFAKNLKDLLMAAPAGPKVTMGIDPGLRTGCKIAIVDATGKLLTTTTIYPHAPQNHWDKSIRTIEQLSRQHKVELIAIGNGTASRETDKLAAEVQKAASDLNLTKIMVSEAGASVYSASEFAANEFPDLDVSLRGAVSIARRLQDPLAELVKIEPKSIGVGQYQHDVSQSQLGQTLTAVVEDCVNSVGVDVNTASVPLLTRVSGLNKTLASNIVKYRDSNGSFSNRKQLKKVERLGPKAFEQAAGFLRIIDGDDPLDASAVHPEAYPVVKQISQSNTLDLQSLIGNSDLLKKLSPTDYVDEKFGLPTVTDIISELDKPGRDPRPEFKTAQFKAGVEKISDLKVGMVLEGVVSNVANFGAFVDVGVHQDGLVHISAITDKFISDPREVVKAGDIVKVKVIEVDVDRKRISFTMRLNDATPSTNDTHKSKPQQKAAQNHGRKNDRRDNQKGNRRDQGNAAMGNAFAEAFAKLKK
ncbi:Tex family protein [Pseudoalteromonas luteoviolacea]|uniref:Transcription accessory protein n=1 Tax=Pseudoalteromonas luteoviolacea S4054 TaxID=1129367 RepID=A0A0F6A4A9_9GAMM|nr:Tex family protein [Pseudoalteromonas luteoviolacea]AOT06736.1 RNA-binding transcriptional accessory protein [Pseudoalteromonas luteoviolacea]AOT11654.1 RNA-binding transcriptional accessory protein [Pseudoalteromonas luteoviolacea]AOT16566.1 RNA-binding transcriptional accessory protein [Pseudoalteromonas luteoviolacea]KKE80888.1 transcription accessory protein [Pseudoalteromonas luteoviolacea S4054]KZN73893.1 transcription accessory protein [Pseudoalteromonas luteoviolacea S4047-1]